MARTRQQYEADLASERHRAEQAAQRQKSQAEQRDRQARADDVGRREKARYEDWERGWKQSASRNHRSGHVGGAPSAGGSSSTGGMIFWLAVVGAALAVFLLHDGASWPIHAAEGAIVGGGSAVVLALTFIVLGWALIVLRFLIKLGFFLFLGYLAFRFIGLIH